jgi:hypothetical protein
MCLTAWKAIGIQECWDFTLSVFRFFIHNFSFYGRFSGRRGLGLFFFSYTPFVRLDAFFSPILLIFWYWILANLGLPFVAPARWDGGRQSAFFLFGVSAHYILHLACYFCGTCIAACIRFVGLGGKERTKMLEWAIGRMGFTWCSGREGLHDCLWQALFPPSTLQVIPPKDVAGWGDVKAIKSWICDLFFFFLLFPSPLPRVLGVCVVAKHLSSYPNPSFPSIFLSCYLLLTHHEPWLPLA